jgi:hypothetical protein
MSELFEALYKSVEKRISISFDDFVRSLKDWTPIGLYENGELIGCVIQKENEVHIGYMQKPKASIKKHLKETLKKVIDEYGYAITYVAEENAEGLKFCKRLGFYELNREHSKIKLKCDRCKYAN